MYTLAVRNFNRRSDGAGFDVEIDVQGDTYSFSYPKGLRGGDVVQVALITVPRSGKITVESDLDS
ncbi:hypothetical protein ABK046_53000, partial [Streptomyces caeruleatus]